MENPIKMDDLGVPTIFGNTHMFYQAVGKNHPPDPSISVVQADLRVISCDGQRNQRSWNSKKTREVSSRMDGNC